MKSKVDALTLSITNHACVRYQERFDRSVSMGDAEAILRQRVLKAAYIWRGSLNGRSPKRYLLDDDMIFVLDDTDETRSIVVTVFRTTYGFGEDIDRTIRARVRKNVRAMHKKLDDAERTLRDTNELVHSEVHRIDSEISRLEAEMKLLQNARRTLTARKDEAESLVSAVDAKLQSEALKLVNSIQYNVETLARATRFAKSAV